MSAEAPGAFSQARRAPGAGPGAPSRLDDLHHRIRSCRLCALHQTRTQAVPGNGPCPADIMIVGEAPGYHEDAQGTPFVGAAGKLLDTLLAGIGLQRQDVYVTNVLKCRPPRNRDPLPEEAETCEPYLREQLDLVRPKVVLVLGRHALERLLPGRGSITRVHGSIIERDGVTYMPLFHPAAALHNGALVKDLERDFDGVRRHLERTTRPPQAAPTPPRSQAQLDLGSDSSPAEPPEASPEPEPEPPAPALGDPEQLRLL